MAGPSNQKLMQQMVKLDGEFKGLRAQFTEFKKKVEGGLSVAREPGMMRGELSELADLLSKERSQRIADYRGIYQGQNALKDQIHQHRNELTQCRQDLQSLNHDFRKHKREVEDTRHGTADFPHQKLQVLSHEVHTFQRRIFDSGILQPKIEKPPPEEPEPVGSLELGQDVYSARMLLRLGLGKAHHGSGVRTMLAADRHASDSADEFQRKAVHTDSDSSDEDCFEIMAGLPVIDVRPGERGYLQLTTGWLCVCLFTIILQLAAVLNIIAFGLLNGNSCLDEPLTNLDWYNIHVSKFFGMVVIGCFMSGDVMDTVNFVMVEILLEPKPPCEVYLFAMFRVLFILLVTCANGVLFIVATTSDGIWLYITAVEFVNALSRAMIGIAKSGVLGHAISKQITDMNFTLCFKQEYPHWFGPVRFVAYLILFGVIGFFACYAFFMPIPMCPADGSKPQNIFVQVLSLFGENV